MKIIIILAFTLILDLSIACNNYQTTKSFYDKVTGKQSTKVVFNTENLCDG